MKRSWKRLLFGALSLALLGVAGVDGAPSATGQSAADPTPGVGTITPLVYDGSSTPLAGFDGAYPSGAEGAVGEAIPSQGGVPRESAYAESVIGNDGRLRVTNTTAFPARAIGQIELVDQGQNFICTGWLIDDNTIASAGHCAYNPSAPNGQEIIEAATIYFGRNRGVDPYGGCPIASVWAPNRWIDNGSPYYDFSIMQLGSPCESIGGMLGHFGMLAFSGVNGLAGRPVTVQGYPGDKPFGTHSKMSGRITKSTATMAFYPIDTAGGQSGSPVWQHRGVQAPGPCVGPCSFAIHAYGVGLPASGPGQNNAGPRLTSARIGLLRDLADDNGG
jgi:glutamyl endopeptidase